MKTEIRHLDRSEPMPFDLKAYIVAKAYDPDKRPFTKIIAALAENKDQLHPYTRRFLVERMREAEARHRDLAKRYGDIAAKFE